MYLVDCFKGEQACDVAALIAVEGVQTEPKYIL
jgi:hypothetical protein